MMTTTLPANSELRRARHSGWIPSRRFEWVYYFLIAYSMLSAYVGIEVPLLAAGITVALSLICFKRLGSLRKVVFAPIAFLVAALLAFAFVEIAVHEASVISGIVRQFILWICG